MYRAKDTFWAPDNRRIVKGDLVAEHDPVLDGREGLFEAVVIPKAVPRLPQPTQPEEPSDAPFDPGEHSATDVLGYLESADLAEAERVLQAESDGKARKGILAAGGPLLVRKEQETVEENPEGQA